MLRMFGELMPIKFRDLSNSELETYIYEVLTPKQKQWFDGGQDLDFSYVSEDGGRFRANIYRKATGLGATFRNIPGDIPALEKLGLPEIVPKLCDYHQGMVLVTGPTGSGKTNTLYSSISLLNKVDVNIMTAEDPVEFQLTGINQIGRAHV